jgi:copper chaperone CopZ
MTTITTYSVTGMTCEHCVSAVTEELTVLDGITAVDVVLAPEGPSAITVTSDAPLALDEVAAAIDEAWYSLADVS